MTRRSGLQDAVDDLIFKIIQLEKRVEKLENEVLSQPVPTFTEKEREEFLKKIKRLRSLMEKKLK